MAIISRKKEEGQFKNRTTRDQNNHTMVVNQRARFCSEDGKNNQGMIPSHS